MAQAVPSIPPPPTKAAAPHHGVAQKVHHPAHKPGQVPGESRSAVHSKFQALLDKLGPKAPAAKAPHQELVPKPAVKAKVAETPHDKPKETKKAAAKDPKADQTKEALAAGLLAQVQPRAEVPKAPKPEGAEALAASGEKHKSAPKPEKKPGTDPVLAKNQAHLAQTAGTTQGQGIPRKLERTEEKPKVFVVDRRSEAKEKDKLKHPAEAAASQPVNTAAEPQSQVKTPEYKTTDSLSVGFQTVAGRTPDGFDLKPQNTPVAPRDAATFQQYLVEKGYGQLVDQARIVLKDNNAGEIRMTLHPESLGKVKVALNLNDNSLAGQIYVENQTVKDVFQANLDGLLQSFRDGGFTNLSLQVSVGNGNGGGNAGQGQAQTAAQARDYGRQVAEVPVTEARAARIGSWNDRQINLTA